MKRKLTAKALIIPLIVAYFVLLPLLGAAVIGEHRYERNHPAYMNHLWHRVLGDEQVLAPSEVPTGGENGRLNILVVGKDKAAGLTDVMMLASLDTKAQQLSLLQIPRDTYAAYTDRDYKKINGAYAALGGQGLVRFLNENMGTDIDHYVCVDLDVLGEMVDLMGGVRMNVPQDMDYDDPAQNLHIHIKAGDQVLGGKDAQSFVRFRSGYALADVGRMDAQKLFMSSLANQAKEKLTLGQMMNLACRCFGKVKTDMKLSDCLECVKQLRSVEMSSMHMATLPGESARMNGDSGAWYYILNKAATEQLVQSTLKAEQPFDPNGVFTNTKKSAFDRIYSAPGERYSVHGYTAQDALDGNITVRRVG